MSIAHRLPSHTTVRTSRIRRFVSLTCVSSYILSIGGKPRDSRYLLDRKDCSGLKADMCQGPWDLACLTHPAACALFSLIAISFLKRFLVLFHWNHSLERSFLRDHLARDSICHLREESPK